MADESMGIHTSRLFQKTLTDMDIAMFCFPESQPPEPYNCSLVSLQFLRLLTPAESSALIGAHPTGVLPNQLVDLIKSKYGQSIERFNLQEIGIKAFEDSIFPGFAALLMLYRTGEPIGHTVVVAKTTINEFFVFDPQTGMIYARNAGMGRIIRSLPDFVEKYGFDQFFGFQYTEVGSRQIGDHLALSKSMDDILATFAFFNFYKRGNVIDERIKTSFNLDIEMRHGRGRKTRKHHKGIYRRRTK
jgi:hypothetical protein